MTDLARARDWYQNEAEQWDVLGDGAYASLAALLARVRAEENKACAALVETERGKLGGRWSLDSAYLHQAIDAIRARSESRP